MSYIGKKFPNINLNSVTSDSKESIVNLSKPPNKTLLFFYPMDFTYVCPTELHAFQNQLGEFEKRGISVYGTSCDTIQVHLAWLKTPISRGGVEGITFPLISDTTRILSKRLQILDEQDVSYRATYLIDENGKVFYESINDMPIGRNINEFIRIIDAKHHNEKFGEVCPANWKLGKKAMEESNAGVIKYFSFKRQDLNNS